MNQAGRVPDDGAGGSKLDRGPLYRCGEPEVSPLTIAAAAF